MTAPILRMIVVAAALWPVVLTAQTVEECAAADTPVEGFDGMMDRGLPEDLGGGWVSQPYVATAEAGSQTGANVMHCESGNAVGVVTLAVGSDGAEIVAAAVDVAAVFRAAIASPEATGIDDILAELEAGGARVQPIAPDGREGCGCAVFYPDLRGDKAAWAEWSVQ
jgi:hypothetical protein